MKIKVTNKHATLHIIKKINKHRNFFVMFSSIYFFNHKKHIKHIKSISYLYLYKKLI